MKTSFVIKAILLIPILLFTDYVLMAIFGCASCLFGLGNEFYCGTYCTIGKIILGVTAVLFFFLIFQDIKILFKTLMNAKTTEK